jgi:hypothetical protein
VDLLTAHEHFASCTPAELRARFDFEGTIELPDIGECTPAALTGACSLSGMLDDAVDDSDLKEALTHFFACLDADIISLDQWYEATTEAVDAVLAWGHERELAAAAWN